MAKIAASFLGDGIINDIIITIYKTTAPSAEVDRRFKAAPHDDPYNYTFTDLEAGVYLVNIHETTDGTTLGRLRHDWEQVAKDEDVLIRRRHYKVDGPGEFDPPSIKYANEDDETDSPNQELNDPYFNGKVIVGVFKPGWMFLEENVDYERTDTGIKLLNEIYFDQFEKWSIDVAFADIAQPSADAAYSRVVEVDSNLILDSSHYLKIIDAEFLSNNGQIGLPILSSVPDGKGFLIRNSGGNTLFLDVAAQSGNQINFRGNVYNQIYLGRGEQFKITKYGSKWRVTEPDGHWERVGERISSDIISRQNALLMDGSEYDGTIYRRVYQYILTKLDLSQRKTYAEWDDQDEEDNYINRGFFAVNTETQRFKVPDIRGMTIKFCKDGEVAGVFEKDMIKSHTHPLSTNKNDSKGGDQQNTLYKDPDHGAQPTTLTTGTNTFAGSENTVKGVKMYPLLLI